MTPVFCVQGLHRGLEWARGAWQLQLPLKKWELVAYAFPKKENNLKCVKLFPQRQLPGQGGLSVCLHGSGHGEPWVNMGQYHQQGH